MAEPTYEELKAKLAELEKKVAANKPARKPLQLFVTPTGELQVRNAIKNGSAHNLEPDAVQVIFDNAQQILGFIKQNSGLLTFSTDDTATKESKQNQRDQLISQKSPLIRQPRVAL